MSDEVKVVQAADEAEPFSPTPPAEMRRGAAVMAAICAAVLGIGRALFWRGEKTAPIPATALFFILIYTIFGFVQLLFGASINELSQNFMRASGKYRALFVVMIVLSVGLLWAASEILFPRIWDKLLFR